WGRCVNAAEGRLDHENTVVVAHASMGPLRERSGRQVLYSVGTIVGDSASMGPLRERSGRSGSAAGAGWRSTLQWGRCVNAAEGSIPYGLTLAREAACFNGAAA